MTSKLDLGLAEDSLRSHLCLLLYFHYHFELLNLG